MRPGAQHGVVEEPRHQASDARAGAEPRTDDDRAHTVAAVTGLILRRSNDRTDPDEASSSTQVWGASGPVDPRSTGSRASRPAPGRRARARCPAASSPARDWPRPGATAGTSNTAVTRRRRRAPRAVQLGPTPSGDEHPGPPRDRRHGDGHAALGWHQTVPATPRHPAPTRAPAEAQRQHARHRGRHQRQRHRVGEDPAVVQVQAPAGEPGHHDRGDPGDEQLRRGPAPARAATAPSAAARCTGDAEEHDRLRIERRHAPPVRPASRRRAGAGRTDRTRSASRSAGRRGASCRRPTPRARVAAAEMHDHVVFLGAGGERADPRARPTRRTRAPATIAGADDERCPPPRELRVRAR